jgi:L-2-hydroxyglutarate oxidase LhgO
MEKIDCVVIGAGVVGLAVARVLAAAGREVVVLEAAAAIGTGNSSRNSEVIHAGIYYPNTSLKAKYCVSGRKKLYAYCESHGIAHRRCGKLIVATSPGQIGRLEQVSKGCHSLRSNGDGKHDPAIGVGMSAILRCRLAGTRRRCHK